MNSACGEPTAPAGRAATVVEAIEAIRRRPGVYAVTCTGGIIVDCPGEVLARWALHAGQILSDSVLAELKGEAESTLARQAALRLLAAAGRTAAELLAALIKRGFSDRAAAQAVARMKELGYIDDLAYARRLAETLHSGGKRGLPGIKAELSRRGVPAELIPPALASIAEEDERATALALATRKMSAYAGLEAASARRKLAGFLARRGYGYETVQWCLSQLQVAGGEDDQQVDSPSW